MFKFMHRKGGHHSTDRLKLQRQLFDFRRTAHHGFPNKPSAMAWDPDLRLLAIATKSGALKVYGQPGVELYGYHDAAGAPVTQITFLRNQGRLVSLLDNNTVHLWEANLPSNGKGGWTLTKKKSATLEGQKLKKITTIAHDQPSNQILLGTEGGNVYFLPLDTFEVAEDIIYQDVIMQNVPEAFKTNFGAVERIIVHPTQKGRILIGYTKGLTVLWDVAEGTVVQSFGVRQQLESLCWTSGGSKFISTHNDGSFVRWDLSSDKEEEKTVPNGPYPCKGITKMLWRNTPEGEMLIYSGGMVRSSHGDKMTVSISQGDNSIVLDFTANVVDFLTISEPDSASEFENPIALFVLTEEELVAVDLSTPGWPLFPLPCLAPLHASAVTCSYLVSAVAEGLWARLQTMAHEQKRRKGLSEKPWPVTGGQPLTEDPPKKKDGNQPSPPTRRTLLLTGHEDGSIRGWDVSGVCMTELFYVSTGKLFQGEHNEAPPPEDEEEWPKFRKVGQFDPFSDDPLLAVKKLWLCPFTGNLVAGGTAGQILMFSLANEASEKPLQVIQANLMEETDSFVWKGHDALSLVEGSVEYSAPGFQPSFMVQCFPPVSVASLTMESGWGLIAAGTTHGFLVVDATQKKIVFSKCTLPVHELAVGAHGDNPMSRKKSFKKSLRQSFRRLRKGRSHHRHGAGSSASGKSGKANSLPEEEEEEKKEEEKKEEVKKEEGKKEEVKKEEGKKGEEKKAEEKEAKKEEDRGKSSKKASEKVDDPEQRTLSVLEDTKPQERQVEARGTLLPQQQQDEVQAGIVRTLYFCECFISSVQHTALTLWAGTNAGYIYIHVLTLPKEDKRSKDGVTCMLAKEIHLKHGAPVVSVTVLDSSNRPLPTSLSVKEGAASKPDQSGPYKVVICSEEQIKVFTLPVLKHFQKYKVTAREGALLRSLGFASFRSPPDAPSTLSDLLLLTLSNQGDITAFSLPELRKLFREEDALRKEDITGILSLQFSSEGEAFYLHSSSEYQRLSLSPNVVTCPRCVLELPPGARPASAPPAAEGPKTGASRAKEAPPAPKKEPAPSGSPRDATAEEPPEVVLENGGGSEHDRSLAEAPQSPTSQLDASILSNDLTLDSIRDHLGASPDAEITITRTEVMTEVKTEKIHDSVTLMKNSVVTTSTQNQDGLVTNRTQEASITHNGTSENGTTD